MTQIAELPPHSWGHSRKAAHMVIYMVPYVPWFPNQDTVFCQGRQGILFFHHPTVSSCTPLLHQALIRLGAVAPAPLRNHLGRGRCVTEEETAVFVAKKQGA